MRWIGGRAVAAAFALTAVAAPALAAGDHSGGHDNHGGDSGTGHTFATGEPGPAEAVDRTVRIEAGRMRFKPDRVTVQPGETVKFVVRNTGRVRHSFVIGTKAEQRRHEKRMNAMSKADMAQHDDPNMLMLKPGETKTLTWTFAHKIDGDARFACHIRQHYAAGMRGDLVVAE